MDKQTFNQNFEIDTQTRKGLRARVKNVAAEPVEIMTADGTAYDPSATYYFFDVNSRQIRSSLGLRRDKEHLSTFGLKVVPIAELRTNRDDAIADAQTFCRSEMEKLQQQIADYDLEKSPAGRKLQDPVSGKEQSELEAENRKLNALVDAAKEIYYDDQNRIIRGEKGLTVLKNGFPVGLKKRKIFASAIEAFDELSK